MGRIRPKTSWLGLLPSLAVLAVFGLYPFIEVVRFSAWDWSGLSAPKDVGLANYRELLTDPAFWHSLWVTLEFALITLPGFILLSLLVAFALEGQPYERWVKGLLFLPGLVTLSAAAVSWYTLLSPEYGALQTLLYTLVPEDSPLASWLVVPAWDREPFWALLLVVAFTLWRYLGYGVLVVSASLKGIPRTLLEAAWVDGATPRQAVRFVTLPLLRPAVTFLLVVGTILALQSYVAVFLLTRGGPFGGTRVLGYFIYEVGFEQYRLGYAAAATIVLLVLTLGLAYAQARFMEER